MEKFGLMVQRAMNPARIPVLVDLGSVDVKETRDCADRLMAAGVHRRNFSIEGHGRLLVKLPTKHAASIIRRFRFQTDVTYWQCTHRRRNLEA